MNPPDPTPITDGTQPIEPNSEPVPREKSTTTARVAISNGPAANAAEARKGKKKRNNKNLPQVDGRREELDGAGQETPNPAAPPSTPATPIVPMIINTPPLTQKVLATTYPPSDPGGTPPRIVMPAHLQEGTPSPLTSPSRGPTTTVNTPQLPFASLQDVEMSPPSPLTQFGPLEERLSPRDYLSPPSRTC
ncbi:hypothetical protein BJY52DRAFT_1226863 [Lactarius psammicola]|nr:hypothetical protein BJY52DRAFT_1226863 [Lactarius psammicola]